MKFEAADFSALFLAQAVVSFVLEWQEAVFVIAVGSTPEEVAAEAKGDPTPKIRITDEFVSIIAEVCLPSLLDPKPLSSRCVFVSLIKSCVLWLITGCRDCSRRGWGNN